MKRLLIAMILLVGTVVAYAEPPENINYQGVLRDAAGNPLDGPHDMVFRMYDAETGGTLLLTDSHTNSDPIGPVVVTGGLFNTHIGAGTIGAGIHVSLDDLFASEDTVWLQIQVGMETLSPRVRIVSAAYALNAGNLDGHDSSDFAGAGHGHSNYINTSSTPQTKVGPLTLDASAVESSVGVYGSGTSSGGYFENATEPAHVYLAYDHPSAVGIGVLAYGWEVGGAFSSDMNGSRAWAAAGDTGLAGYGPYAGVLVRGDVGGASARGVEAHGTIVGGHFENIVSGHYAELGTDTFGVYMEGLAGGYFTSTDGMGWGYLGIPNIEGASTGVEGNGYYQGMYASDLDSGTSASIARGVYGVYSNGSAFFATGYFSPPGPKDQESFPTVISYAAPAGDEVATYTRGTARLRDGEARVPLADTFKWVTNPDIGLTAYLSPRGNCLGLYVESLSTSELVVRELNEGKSDVVFDFVVFGLRIGFEEVSIVGEGAEKLFIPSKADHRELYERRPELRQYNALERFKTMRQSNGATEPLDLTASIALENSIGEYEPTIHGQHGSARREFLRPARDARPESAASESSRADEPVRRSASPSRGELGSALVDVKTHGSGASCSQERVFHTGVVQITEAVEPGDVLGIDHDKPGMMSLARTAFDPGVVGIVATEPSDSPEAEPLTVSVAFSGVALCKVDATFGSIRPSDLLTTSPTPGHAMLARNPQPGTIIGKALEPLDTGTGLIKVLVMLR